MWVIDVSQERSRVISAFGHFAPGRSDALKSAERQASVVTDTGLERVEVAWGTGEGRTELAAFDAALADAGVGDYNLVRLSSVVPADCAVELVDTHERRFPVGQPVACVVADATTTEGTVSAGLGWSLADEGGVFMEEHAADAEACREKLVAGLRDGRELREWAWEEELRTKVVEHDVEECGAAVVVAVYAPVELQV